MGDDEKTIDTLIEDIYGELGKYDASEQEDMLEEAASFAADVMSSAVRQMSKRDKERPPHTLYASEIGKPCHRQIDYSINNPELGEELEPHTRLKFLYGDILEDLLLYLAHKSGHAVEYMQHPVSYKFYAPLGSEWEIRGKIDAVIDGHVVDVKSASSYAFKKFSQGTIYQDDPFGYISQLTFYQSSMFINGYVPNRHPCFLVINKETGKLCLHVVDVDNPDLIADHDWRKKSKELVVDLESKARAPRMQNHTKPFGKTPNTQLGVNCSYCAYRMDCHPNVRVFLYSGNKPVFMTEVVNEPRVPEVTHLFQKK